MYTLSEQKIKEQFQIENFKSIEGKKLTMSYQEKNDCVYLIGKDEEGISYELAEIKR